MNSANISVGVIPTSGTNPRRRRPPVSCALCRQRKIRCNREDPCSNCVRMKSGKCVYQSQPLHQHRSGRKAQTPPIGAIEPCQQLHQNLTGKCVYQSQSPQQHRSGSKAQTPLIEAIQTCQQLRQNLNTFVDSPTDTRAISSESSQTVLHDSTSPTSTRHSPPQEVEILKAKIRQLEHQLAQSEKSPAESSAPTPISDFETVHSHLAGTFHVHNESFPSNQGQTIRRSFFHKKRFFGQSHWISSMALFRDIVISIEPYLMEEGSKALLGLQKCKHLGRKIKAQRTPQWPVPITTDLPSKDICDTLLDCYLGSFERVYRVLHVPSFKKDYEAFWKSQGRHDAIFLVQLKLVLAIGCITYDDELSLRSSAIHFVYEAQTWLSEPETKARLGIPFLQAQILLLLARDLLGVDGGMIWVAAGTLLRTAVYMGLHRDPVQIPNMSKYVSEMHRRLWSTTLEICLQYSMDSGGSPLISLEECDTQPPGNFDDDDITIDTSVPHPDDRLTSTSISIALRKTLPIRLAIARFLNDANGQSSYEEAIRLDARLRASCKEMRWMIQRYGMTPSRLEISMLDFIIRRYLISIHIPFFGPSFLETTYAFSRSVVIDTAGKIFNSALKPPTPLPNLASKQSEPSHQTDFRRLTTCGSGFFRTAPLHCSFLIAVELKNQIIEEEGLGPVSLRPDLVSVLHEADALSLRSIEIGETNIKGHLFMSLVTTQIDALMRGVTKEEIPKLLIQAAEEAEDKCLLILESIAAKGQREKMGNSLESASGTELPDMGEDWDFMMADGSFNLADMELPSWMLGSMPYGIP